ncbi:MAG: 5'-nucleotidase, partial [Desulfobacterales bacterium]|nr:5'-nucleotidase [Desulfobacterales bacterium]
EVIGRSSVFLDAERVRYEETALGNLVTDIIRQYSHADMALLNGGSLRAGIDAGPVTVEDVFKTMPFANEVVLVELSGAEILQVLGRSVKGNRGDEDGGFLQVSGLRFAVRNHGVENVAVGPQQEALDIDKRYRVAINDFLAAGGDGYALFKEKPAEYTGLPLRELIVETIRTRGVVTAEIEGRIVRK